MSKRPVRRFTDADVRLGYVSGVHGILGEVKLFLYNPDSDLLGQRSEVGLVAPDGQRRVGALRLRQGAGRRILAHIEGVGDRNAAAALKGWELVVPAADLPAPTPGSWYHRDLMGLAVRTQGGRELGRIAEIHATGQVDVWVLDGPGGQRVLPVLRDFLVEVCLATDDQPGHVVVTDDAVDEQPPL